PPQQPPMRAAGPTQAPRAPLPPRGVLPNQQQRMTKPMQAPNWMDAPGQGAPVIARGPAAPSRGAPPPNLPIPSNPPAAQREEGAFNALPPLAKPKPRPGGGAPASSSGGDPYREPLE